MNGMERGRERCTGSVVYRAGHESSGYWVAYMALAELFKHLLFYCTTFYWR